MMPVMTREQFEKMTIEELVEWAFENIDYVHHEDALLDLAKHEIDEENLNVAIHILTGVYESEEAVCGYYIYDRSMGTLDLVVPITCKEDLEDYIDFGEEADAASLAEEWAWRQEGYFAENKEEENEND